MTIITLFIGLGFIASLLSGMLGIGGGVLMTPILLSVLGHTIGSGQELVPLAIHTSLVITLINAAYNLYRQSHYLVIDKALLKTIIPATFIGVVLGSLISTSEKQLHLGPMAGGLFIWLATLMIFKRQWQTFIQKQVSTKVLHFTGFLIGTSSSLLGIGGGSLMMPIFNVLGIELKRIISIAAIFTLIATISSLFAMALFTSYNHGSSAGLDQFIYWPAVFSLIPSMLVGVNLGAMALHRLPSKLTETLLVVFLLSLALIYCLLMP